MSVRAYKNNYLGNRTTQTNEEPSFNCWREQEVFKALIDDTGAVEQLGDSCTGNCSVPVQAIVELLENKEIKLHKDTRKMLKQDIEEFDLEDIDEDEEIYVDYSLF
jgi:hypothetical protein